MKVNSNRIDLAKEAPLDTPLSINFETTTRCNFACIFCPTSNKDVLNRVGFVKQDMPVQLFHKYIDDLKEFPRKIKVNHYHIMGEPLINPNFFSMVRYAVDANVAENHWLRTNGSLLTSENIDRLVACGLTRIGISIEAVNEEGYRNLVKRNGMFERVVNGVSELYNKSRGICRIYAKICNFETPETNPEEFKRIFSPITDECEIEYPMQWNNGVPDSTLGLGVRSTVNGDKITTQLVCPFPFYTLAINSRGKVTTCCFDWSTYNEIGDANKESIKEIWNGQRISDFWKMQLEGKKSTSSVCKDCLNCYVSPDNLDNSRYDILKRLENKEKYK